METKQMNEQKKKLYKVFFLFRSPQGCGIQKFGFDFSKKKTVAMRIEARPSGFSG
jgi:hypothetical protein